MDWFWEARRDPYGKFWQKGVWAVEFKDPRLMVARCYTPLPPVVASSSGVDTTSRTESDEVAVIPSTKDNISTLPPAAKAENSIGDENMDSRNGDLRFLIRGGRRGEVSNYIANLQVGEWIELRGPRQQVDLIEKNDAEVDGQTGGEVLFLAGGTGIAPALQVAYAVLEGQNPSKGQKEVNDAGEGEVQERPKVTILWAVRRREECNHGSVVEQLKTLERKHGPALRVEYFVDEEKSFIDQKKLNAILSDGTRNVDVHGSSRGKGMVFVSGPEGFTRWLVGQTSVAGEGKMRSSEDVGGLVGMVTRRGTEWRVCYL